MSLVDDVSAQMKQALKAKEAVRLRTLRSIRAGFLNEMKKDGSDSLSDESCLQILRKLEKQRKESIEAFEAAGRSEQAAEEKAELEVIASFLPSLADAATTRAWVEEAIASSGARSSKELGKVMGALMKAHKGDVDGNLARAVASELLGD